MLRLLVALTFTATLAACSGGGQTGRAAQSIPRLSPQLVSMYGAVDDAEVQIPAVPAQYLSERNVRQIVDFPSDKAPGTIVVDPFARFLYLVQDGGTAMRYGIAVGEAGRAFAGNATVAYQRDWPNWTPTQNMIRREPEVYGKFAGGVEGGVENPLGARALYLYRNGRDTMYRIHGTPQPWTIGHAASSGCIRLYNQDIIDLAERVDNGTRVVVLSEAQSMALSEPLGEQLALAN